MKSCEKQVEYYNLKFYALPKMFDPPQLYLTENIDQPAVDPALSRHDAVTWELGQRQNRYTSYNKKKTISQGRISI